MNKKNTEGKKPKRMSLHYTTLRRKREAERDLKSAVDQFDMTHPDYFKE
jgi:hypothetical protein